MSFKRSASVLAAAAAIFPATAGAAEWQAVGPISSTDPTMSSSILNYGIDGDGVLTVLFRDIDIDDQPGALHLLDRAPKAKLVPGQTFPATGLPALAVAPDGERIAAYSTGAEGAQQVEVRTRQGTGAWTDPIVVAQNLKRVVNVSVEVAGSGDVVAGWIETPTSDELAAQPDVRDNWNLYAGTRAGHGPAFQPAQKLATGKIAGFATALDAHGGAIVGWVDEAAGSAFTARRSAGGTFGAPEPHTVPGQPASFLPVLSVAPEGRAVMAWPVGAVTPSSDTGAAAIVGSTTDGFGEPRLLAQKASSYLGAVVDDFGAAISWVDQPGSSGKLKAILVGPTDNLADRPVRVVSPAGVPYDFFDNSAIGHGRATFAWVRRVSGPLVVEARTADSNGKFTKTQTLSSRTYTASRVLVTTSSRAEPWVAWGAQARNVQRSTDGIETAKASSTNGVFGRTVALPRGGGIDQINLISGKDGTMLVAYRRGYWYLRSYGE